MSVAGASVAADAAIAASAELAAIGAGRVVRGAAAQAVLAAVVQGVAVQAVPAAVVRVVRGVAAPAGARRPATRPHDRLDIMRQAMRRARGTAHPRADASARV